MKRRNILSAIAGALLLFTSGCLVAGGPVRRTYYYYPDDQVYYYPSEGRYYWFDRGQWRDERNPPPRFIPRDRDRVRIDSDHEPYKDHERNQKLYPSTRNDRDDRNERRDDRRDDRKDDRRDSPGPDRR